MAPIELRRKETRNTYFNNTVTQFRNHCASSVRREVRPPVHQSKMMLQVVVGFPVSNKN